MSSDSIARGRISVDISQLHQAERGVKQATVSINSSLSRMGSETARVSKNISNNVKSMSDSMGNALNDLDELFSGVLITGGIKVAQNVKQIDILFNTLSGSQEKVASNMEQIVSLSNRTGTPILKLKEAAVSLLPAINRNNVELDRTLSVAQRLAILDPFQGFEGAAFALREALSGDARSLALRFELPKNALNEIISSSAGDPQKIIEGIDELVNNLGLTEDSLKSMSEEGIDTFGNLGSAVKELVSTAFMPLLKGITPIIQGITSLFTTVSNTLPLVPQIIGFTFTWVASVHILNTALMRTQQLYQNINTSATFASRLQKTGMRVAGGAIAGIAGIEIGTSISRGLANAGIGDQSLRGASQDEARDILSKRIQQVAAIFLIFASKFAPVIGLFVASIQTGATLIKNAIGMVVAVFNIGRSLFHEVFNRIIYAFGSILDWIGSNFSGLGLGHIGETGRNLMSSANAEIQQSQQLRQQSIDTLRAGILTESDRQSISKTFSDTTNTIAEGLQGIANTIARSVMGITKAFDGANSTIEPTVDEMRNSLQEHAEAIQETADKIKDINDSFNEETEKIQNRRDLSDTREREDFDRSRGKSLSNFALQESRDADSFYKNMRKKVSEFRKSEKDSLTTYDKDRLSLISNYYKQQQEREAEHQKRLIKIREDANARIAELASRLDARGIAEAQRQANAQIAEEITNNDESRISQNNQLQQDLSELQTNLQEQSNLRRIQFEESLKEEKANFEESRKLRRIDFEARLQEEDEEREIRKKREEEDRKAEDEEREQQRRERIDELKQTLEEETQIQKQYLEQAISFMNEMGMSWSDFLNSVSDSMIQAMYDMANAPSSGGDTNKVEGFASGGRPPVGKRVIVGESGREMVQFDSPATVFSNSQFRDMNRPVSNNNTINQNFNFGDIGNKNPSEIRDMFYGFMEEFVDKVQNGV